MTQTTAEWRSTATFEDLEARASEMRGEWAEVSSKADRESTDFKRSKAEFLAEMEDVSLHMGLLDLRGAGPAHGAAPAGAFANHGTVDFRSPGQRVVDNEAFRAWQTRGAQGESPNVELRTLVSTPSTSAGPMLPVGQPYLAEIRRRRLFVRDLLQVNQTTLSAIPYVREKNQFVNASTASTVVEGATKPEATVEFVGDLAVVQVIAATLPVTTQVAADAPSLMSYINGRLTYMVKLAEEKQVLAGAGTGADIKGIRSFAIQTQAFATDIVTTIGNSIAKIEVVDGYADGVVMNPADAWAMYLNRASTSGVLDIGTPFANVPLYVWGLPVVRSNSIEKTKALVGNWEMGATLWDREQANVRIFEQHSTFAAENKVLLRAEERVALTVNAPDYFVLATVS